MLSARHANACDTRAFLAVTPANAGVHAELAGLLGK
jgi:hypothetical protein